MILQLRERISSVQRIFREEQNMEVRVWKVLDEVNDKITKYTGEDMLEDEIIESMEIMDIVVGLEDEFGFEIAPEYILPEYFMTKETILKLVEETLQN